MGSAFNLHSIINSGLIPGGQKSSKRQTVFFLPTDPRDKCHKDPEKIDLNVPRRAQYLHSAWKKHQDAVLWVDLDLAIRKGLTFYQTRSNEIILQGIFPSYCVPKVVRLKTGEVLYEKSYMSPRPPPKISLRHDWTKELGSKVDRQPEGEVARPVKFFQPTQPIPNPIRERSGQPDLTQDVTFVQTCSSEDSKSLNVEQTHDRSGQPGEDTVAIQDDSEVYHEDETLNINDETIREKIEADMDFKIPGLPRMLKSMSSSLIARLNSLFVLNDAMSRFSSGANCSFTVCALELFRATGCPDPLRVCSKRMFSDSLSGFPDLSENQVLRANLFHRSRENGTFHLQQQTQLLCYQVSPIDHRLVWVWIGFVWRISHVELLQKTVERVYRLAVVQL